jgi:hypothetical protein
MYKFDEGPNFCMKCKKNVIKPCFFLLETAECLRLQESVKKAQKHVDLEEENKYDDN